MKKIIGLFGRANCGKSITLKELIFLLDNQPETKKINEEEAYGDLRTTFICKNKKVCIASGGDYKSVLDENCAYFEKNDFDIAISATRARGETCSSLNYFANKYKENVEWHRKCAESFGKKNYQQDINEIEIKELFERINELCDEG